MLSILFHTLQLPLVHDTTEYKAQNNDNDHF